YSSCDSSAEKTYTKSTKVEQANLFDSSINTSVDKFTKISIPEQFNVDSLAYNDPSTGMKYRYYMGLWIPVTQNPHTIIMLELIPMSLIIIIYYIEHLEMSRDIR